MIVKDKVDVSNVKIEAEKTKDSVSIDLPIIGQQISKKTMLRLDRLIEAED